MVITTISAFRKALATPHTSLRTLRGVVPLTEGGLPIVRRTSRFAEAEIVMPDGRRALLHAPLSPRAIAPVTRTAEALCSIGSQWLGEYRILEGEMLLRDSFGREQWADLILEVLPEGEPLDRCTMIDGATLRRELLALQREMHRIGFSHGNLRAGNLIVGHDGRLHPIRPHYGRFDGASDDFAPLFALADSLTRQQQPSASGVLSDVSCAYHATQPIGLTEGASATQPDEERFPIHEGLVRTRRGTRYGYLDASGMVCIPFEWVWADDFREGRAVVETPDGVGVIDKRGEIVVAPVWDNIRYDVSRGEFYASLGEECTTIGYDGRVLRSCTKE